MSLDLDRLEKPRCRGGKLIARCPACGEMGADKSCGHLFIADEGRGPFGCIVFPGPAGAEHRRRIHELAGDHCQTPRPWPVARAANRSRVLPRIPALRPLAWQELVQIAFLRGWVETTGMAELSRRGLLHHGMVWDDGRKWPAWVIADAARRNAQARRLDGKPWAGIGGAKPKSLPDSDPFWPVGASDIGSRHYVMLCEGGPDFLAALYVVGLEGFGVDSVAPVCMTGAANPIHTDALPFFSGRNVRIATHDDSYGVDAGERWAEQLYSAGAESVSRFDFGGLTLPSGSPVEDLADFARLFDSGEFPAERLTAGW